MTKNAQASQDLTVYKSRSVRQLKSVTSQADVEDIVEVAHRKYLIRAGLLSGVYVARAFPKPPSKARGLIAEAQGDNEQAAVAALMSKIEARDKRRQGERRWSETMNFAIPNEAEYAEALNQTPLNTAQLAMIKALAWTREDGLSCAELASAAGYKKPDMAAKLLSKIGEMFADYLAVDTLQGAFSTVDGVTPLLAMRLPQGEDKPVHWGLHPELRAAARQIA